MHFPTDSNTSKPGRAETASKDLKPTTAKSVRHWKKKQNKKKTVATFRALESCRGKVDCDANDRQPRVTSQLEALCFLRQPLSSCSLGLRVYRRDVFALLISQCCNIQSLNRWEGANSGVRQIGVQILPPLLPSCVTRAGCLLLTRSQYFHPKNGGNFRIYPITRG